jgi:hypothetical protein
VKDKAPQQCGAFFVRAVPPHLFHVYRFRHIARYVQADEKWTFIHRTVHIYPDPIQN